MIINIGDKGDQVRQVQELLKKAGYNISVDGDFGPNTKAAVEQFQKSKKLSMDGIVGPITLEHLKAIDAKPVISQSTEQLVDKIIGAMKIKGYPIYTQDMKLNLVGLRKMPGTPNAFDDSMVCFYYKNGKRYSFNWMITTDPGIYWLQNTERTNGTAILIPGHYSDCWVLGFHKGQYEALTQSKSGIFKNWRDNNRNRNIDYTGIVYNDVLGLNCHKAGKASTVVDEWSAACQVHAYDANFYEMMSLAHKQVDAGMKTFSYTLLEWDGSDIL